jgi:hypothetical protein
MMMVFLRPYTAPLLLAAIPFVWQPGQWRTTVRTAVVNLSIVASLLAVADGIWVARNYRLFGRFVPFQINDLAGYAYTPGEVALIYWLGAIGQETVYWQPNVFSSWFYKRTQFSSENYRVPSYIPTSQCTFDDILRAREIFDVSRYGAQPSERAAADGQAKAMFDGCRESFRREKPLQYYVLSPLRLLKALYVHAGPELPLPATRTLLKRPGLLIIKLFGVASYWVILLLAAGGLVLIAQRRNWRLWAVVTPLLLVSGLFTIVFRRPEVRMLTIPYPALCLLAAMSIDALRYRLKARGSAPSQRARVVAAV